MYIRTDLRAAALVPALILLVLILLVAGCGGRSSPLIRDDAGASGEYCSGAAKLSINNKPYTVTGVRGTPLAMGCCDGAYVTFNARSSDGKTATVTVVIKAAGPSFGAADVDLAKLPPGLEIYVSYQPCSPPTCAAMYRMLTSQDIFAGKANITGTPYKNLKVSLCLTAQAPTGDPNFADVTLWARDVPIK